jgi:hypothetical protein
MGIVLCVQRASDAGNLPYPYTISGSYAVEAEARDDHVGAMGLGPSEQDIYEYGVAPSINNVVDYSTQPSAEVNKSSSATILTMHGQVGSFQIFTSAIANSARVTNDAPLYIVEAQATNNATLRVSDYIQLDSKATGPVILNAKWTISGNLTAMATGTQSANSSDGFLFDYTQSTAESYLGVDGTGVAPGPINGNDTVVFGPHYAEHYMVQGGKQPPPTIDHVEADPPKIGCNLV